MFRDVRAEIRETFRRTRLRYTSQRHAMLEHLWQSAGHLTAEQIFAGINHSDSRAARATVYNNLHALVRAGVLQEVTLGAGPVRYDINVRRHHHFLCDRCGGLEDYRRLRSSGSAAAAAIGIADCSQLPYLVPGNLRTML
jgi:Fe2+ or Zn2+ uptake regulation protein